MELYTGYDFIMETEPWQNLYYKMKWKTGENFSSAFSTYYDLNEKKWGAFIGQVRYYNKNNGIELGARYDAKNQKLTSAKALFNINLFGDFYLRGFTSYDGSQKEFDYIFHLQPHLEYLLHFVSFLFFLLPIASC